MKFSATKTGLMAGLGLAMFIAALPACSDDNSLKVTGLEPKEGQYDGSDSVTIKGSGFLNKETRISNVYFGGAQAKILEVEADKIVVRPPAGNRGETVKVKLVFTDSRVFENPRFTFKYVDASGGFGVGELTGSKGPAKKPDKK